MRVIKIIFFLWLTTASFLRLGGQEMLHNPSFESLSSYPNSDAQISLANNWEDRMVEDGGYNLHSVDLYSRYQHSHTDGGAVPGSVIASEGNNYIGALDFELFQQKMKVKPLRERIYYCSFDFRLSDRASGGGNVNIIGSTINIYLARDEVKYKEENEWIYRRDCLNDYREKAQGTLANQKIKKVASFQINNYNSLEWIQEGFSFSVEDDNYEYFVVETDFDATNYGGIFCANSYVLYDNFSMMDICDHPCRPDLSATKIFKLFGGTAIEELDYNQQIISQQAQITSNQANLFGIENATYVQLLISNRWGDTRVFEYADPMGLHNVASAPLPSRKSFTLLWPGLWHNNGAALSGAYSYKLTVKSCSFNRVYRGSIAYLAYPRDDDFLTDYDPYINYSPPVHFNINCCQNGNLIINSNSQLQNLNNRLVYSGYIQVSGSLTPSQINHNFFSGEFIEIFPEADLRAHQNNEYLDLKITSLCRSLISEEKSEISEKKSEKSEVPGIYPNPAKIGETIVVTVDKSNSFRLMNSTGQTLKQGTLNQNENQITINQTGLFLLQIGESVYKLICLE